MTIKHALITLFLIISLSACFSEQEGGSSYLKTETSIQTPDRPFQDLNGTSYTMENLKGKPIIINFWATWCPPCRAEMPSMNRAWAKVKDEGILMFAANVGESPETIAKFTEEIPIDFPIILDVNAKLSMAWGVRGMPTTYIIDAKGKVVYSAVGERPWDDDSILDAVRALK
ncbi:MAG: Thiol:disulfide oxidoreductase related to ResA [uncultured Thiotrichaceae bacterium]|uniref:Thiol:disulfide oxidoreductase related to ResA n=1 Tax=uncultured Thiotrichaceae bacterium TaxID=298394 RepID=A0A6S6TKY8_9GAMM|nr:MAG: Thiol:disulfide oxidoreductase related to ResA [uncultured Thiotrichaceae bacterium]